MPALPPIWTRKARHGAEGAPTQVLVMDAGGGPLHLEETATIRRRSPIPRSRRSSRGSRCGRWGRCRATSGSCWTDDFRLDEPIPYVAVPRGKGGRLAAVPLVPEAIAAPRRLPRCQRLGPWPRSSVNPALAAAARRAGRSPFTTYQIRHSFAAALWRTGTDVADIQDLYGHPLPETTMIYAPPELPKHLAALERLRRNDGTGTLFPAGPAPLAGEVDWPDSA